MRSGLVEVRRMGSGSGPGSSSDDGDGRGDAVNVGDCDRSCGRSRHGDEGAERSRECGDRGRDRDGEDDELPG